MTDETSITTHYRSDDLFARIIDRLSEDGISNPKASDLKPVDEFHIGGTAATEFVIDALAARTGDEILDVGCGLGGPARTIAERSRANIIGIDLSKDYVETGNRLSALTGFADSVCLHEGSALDMPFADNRFDGAYMIHVGMNIANKNRLIIEIGRTIKPNSPLVIYDVVRVGDGNMEFPVPWANNAADSAVDDVGTYESAFKAAGLELNSINNKSEFTAVFIEKLLNKMKSETRPALGLHMLMGDNAHKKVETLFGLVSRKILAPMVFSATKL